jgi:hypothetical protein
MFKLKTAQMKPLIAAFGELTTLVDQILISDDDMSETTEELMKVPSLPQFPPSLACPRKRKKTLILCSQCQINTQTPPHHF